MGDHLADLARALVVGLGALDLGAIAVVTVLHFRAWRRHEGHGRLLPFHVWTVATAQGALVLGVVLAFMDQLTDPRTPPLSWRTALYVLGVALTLVALVLVARIQRSRVQVPAPDDAGDDTDVIRAAASDTAAIDRERIRRARRHRR